MLVWPAALMFVLLPGQAEPAPPGFLRTLTNPTPRHDGKAISVAYSPDGKLLATGGWDKRIRLWDAATGKAVRDWPAHDPAVWPLAFSADGKQLLSAGKDGKVVLWALDGTEVRRFDGHTAGVYKLAWLHDEDRLLTASFDKSVREWQVSTGKELRKAAQDDEVHALAVAPDRKSFATGTDRGKITLYRRDLTAVTSWQGHGTGIDHLAYSPDGKTLVSGGWDRTAVLWDPTDGAKLRTFEGHKDNVWPAVFSPDGKRLVTASRDGLIRVWNPATGDLVRELDGPSKGVPLVAFRPDGKVFAATSWDGSVRQWELESGKPVGPAVGHLGRILDLRLSRDGKELASLGADGALLSWDTRTGQPTRTSQARLEEPIFGVIGARFAALGTDSATGLLFDRIRTGPGTELSAAGGHLAELHFASDERRLLALRGNGRLLVHDTADGKEVGNTLLGKARALAVTPDGTGFVALSPNESLRWHRLEDLRPIRAVGVAADGPLGLRFSRDGRLLVGIGPDRVTVWEAATGLVRHRIDHTAGQHRPMAFSPDGRLLYLADAKGGWTAIDLRRGVRVRERQGPAGEATRLAVSGDGTTLAVGVANGDVHLWNLAVEPPPVASVVNYPEEKLRRWLDDLAGSNGDKVQAAIAGLTETGPAAVATIAAILKPAAPVDPGRVRALIRALDADDFDERDKARLALLRLGSRVLAEVERAVPKAVSPEQRRLLQAVRDDLAAATLDAEALRDLRLIEVLEGLGARAELEPVAKGDPEAESTKHAKAALERLGR